MTIKDNDDMLNMIVSENVKTKEEVKTQNEQFKTVIDDISFFRDNLDEGIGFKKDFLNVIRTSSKHEIKSIFALLSIMTDGGKFNTTDFPMTDSDGKECYWIKKYGDKGGTTLRVPYFDGLSKLISGYLFGAYSINISMQGLYEEAKRG
ncbi:hypothetical protein [Pedobacter sp. MR2016-24]|uniref:hypothetical protein n=1 Tax=Pedobacter sp. MR2016-24 TaxID=2994466 RepID=UPI0022452D5D|nr:hypothetical protein [Pedobacter sp. MR2016-24]MCX2482834.1 hypothetical protein [Pedobacter sp. MR2016-24]